MCYFPEVFRITYTNSDLVNGYENLIIGLLCIDLKVMERLECEKTMECVNALKREEYGKLLTNDKTIWMHNGIKGECMD